jgi:methylphosphotriester-DNA--protein-cysteine methyltransferase
MKLARQIACGPLRSLVAGFGQRRIVLPATIQIATPPARPNHMIEFYLADRYGIAWHDRPYEASPETAVVGPQSRPGLSIRLAGTVDVFTIYFQPTGLHRLFGWSMPALVDEGVELPDLLGPRARSLRAAVAAHSTFARRVEAAEAWLLAASESAAPASSVDHAARLLLRASGGVRIADLAARSELGVRQFERRFTAAVGLPPKLYGRTARLARALACKERRPELGWAEVAFAAGYADQAHLVRDCSALAGAPPTRFMSQSFNTAAPLVG